MKDLDRLADAAWPALDRTLASRWLLRAAQAPDGSPVTKRANSALPLVDGPPTAAQLAATAAFYRERGLPPLVQVSDPRLAAALDDAGWEALSPTLVMTGPLGDGDAGLVGPLTDVWLTALEPDGPRRAVVRDCLDRLVSPAGFATVEQDGAVVALARGVVAEGRLGVFGMAVRPGARREGLATRLLGALGAWGRERGATSAYLQVEVGNAPARALYDRAGFVPAHEYHYRRLP